MFFDNDIMSRLLHLKIVIDTPFVYKTKQLLICSHINNWLFYVYTADKGEFFSL